MVTDHIAITVFEGCAIAADIETQGSVEFKRVTPGGGFRIAKHHTDLFTELVDKDAAASGAADGGGQLTHGL